MSCFEYKKKTTKKGKKEITQMEVTMELKSHQLLIHALNYMWKL